MHEQINQPTKKTEVFHRLNPYDLITILATFDDREITFPPRTYFPAIDLEQQLKSVTADLIEAFGSHLLFVGLSGSRANDPDKQDRDLDVLAIVDDSAVGENGISFEGDLKIVSHTGLRESIECGYSLITGQFRKAVPLFEQNGVLDGLRLLKPAPEKAIPFLVTKSKFSEQTADIFRLTSDKYRAIFLHQQGFIDAAFSQLASGEHDSLFQSLQTVDSSVYAMLAKYYANLGLNRIYHSMSEMLHAFHIKEMGDVLDVDQLLDWALQRMGEIGALFDHIYKKRVACYKGGEILLDVEYDMLRKGIREKNIEVENMIFNR